MSDYDQGLRVRREILGDAWVDKSLAKKNDFNGEFQELITRFVWAKTWTRPGLDHKTRRCMVLSTMVALARWSEFRLHVRAALEGGMTKDDIKEIILQATVYCGAPAGNHAVHEAEDVFAEMGR